MSWVETLRRTRDVGAVDPAGAGRGQNLAVGFLVVYLVFLTCLPAQLVLHPVGSPGSPANLWGVAGFIWWACLAAARISPASATTPIRVAAGLLGAAILASYANGMRSGWYAPPGVRQEFDDVASLVPATVAQVNTLMVSAADRGLLTALSWFGVVLISAEGLRSWRDVERVVAVMTSLGALVAAVGIVQYSTGFNVVQYISVPGLSANSEVSGIDARSVLARVSATAVHPIEFGVVMACLFPLALHRALHVRSSWSRLATLLVFVASFLAVSRSALLCLLVIGVIVLAGWPARWRLRALAVVPFAVIGLRVVFPGLVGTLVSLFTNLGNDPSVDGRTDDYAVVFDLAGDHLWFGRGLYTFVPQTYRILDNQWLVALLELGLVGVVAVLGLVLTAFFAARSAHRRASSSRHRHLALMLSASIAAAAVGMSTYDAWTFRMQAGLAFLTMGLAGAAWRLAREETSNPPGAAPHDWV